MLVLLCVLDGRKKQAAEFVVKQFGCSIWQRHIDHYTLDSSDHNLVSQTWVHLHTRINQLTSTLWLTIYQITAVSDSPSYRSDILDCDFVLNDNSNIVPVTLISTILRNYSYQFACILSILQLDINVLRDYSDLYIVFTAVARNYWQCWVCSLPFRIIWAILDDLLWTEGILARYDVLCESMNQQAKISQAEHASIAGRWTGMGMMKNPPGPCKQVRVGIKHLTENHRCSLA